MRLLICRFAPPPPSTAVPDRLAALEQERARCPKLLDQDFRKGVSVRALSLGFA